MDNDLTAGLEGRAERVVTHELCAAEIGSGDLMVLATPAMSALMEEACCNCLRGKLEESETTVGTALAIEHSAATPIGLKIFAVGRLENREGSMLFFSVEAFDETGKIGGGTHQRVIVNRERFIKKTEAKKKGNE